MQGVSYNLVLIGIPLLFWAMVKWRVLAAAAIGAWRARRTPPAPPLSSYCGPAAPYPAALQVTASPALPGQVSGTGSGTGPGQGWGQGSGEGWRSGVETRDDGVTGVWIKVQPGGGGDA